MLELVVENSFDKDLLLGVINKLQKQEPLELKHKDHKLRGNFKECRECHIKPNLLLIYQIKKDNLHLIRLGSHSQLFKK